MAIFINVVWIIGIRVVGRGSDPGSDSSIARHVNFAHSASISNSHSTLKTVRGDGNVSIPVTRYSIKSEIVGPSTVLDILGANDNFKSFSRAKRVGSALSGGFNPDSCGKFGAVGINARERERSAELELVTEGANLHI